jgi:hypothetical protein
MRECNKINAFLMPASCFPFSLVHRREIMIITLALVLFPFYAQRKKRNSIKIEDCFDDFWLSGISCNVGQH